MVDEDVEAEPAGDCGVKKPLDVRSLYFRIGVSEKVCTCTDGVVNTVIIPFSCLADRLLAILAGTEDLFGTLESLANLEAEPHVHIPLSTFELFLLGLCSSTDSNSRLSIKRQNRLL
jgi:hypothetical protein